MAGGGASGSCLLTCCMSCGATSSSVLAMARPPLKRVSMSIALPRQNVPRASSSGFSLFPDRGPQGIHLHATELLWPHQLLLNALHLRGCSLHPSTDGFFFDPLHPLNRCQAIAISHHGQT